MGWRKRTAPETDGPVPRQIDNDDDQAYGQAYKYEADFSGPIKNRSCTDILCLLLFLAFLGGWGFVAFFGIQNGDIGKVLKPTDSNGQICGEGPMKDRPYLLFYDLTKCMNPAVLSLGCPTPQVCVEKCPDENLFGYGKPEDEDKMKPFCKKTADLGKDYKTLVKENDCPAWVLKSSPFADRCMPSLGDPSEPGKNDNTTVVIEAGQTVNNEPISKGTLKFALTALGGKDQGNTLGIFTDFFSEGTIKICLPFSRISLCP